MFDVIQEELKKIEQRENIRILHCVESGSRAWGFASPDSDYDVRFIYVRPLNDYLKLEKIRDVIELPINNDLDINGWDLKKALVLLHNSNASLFEWFRSSIIYRHTDFSDEFQEIMGRYFITGKGLYHYLSMAGGNYREYLKGDMVRAKKYFYVIRPILACRWIIRTKSIPPILFNDLVQSELPDSLKGDISRLLDIKMHNPELKLIPKIEALNNYIEEELVNIKKEINRFNEDSITDYKELDDFFLKWVD